MNGANAILPSSGHFSDGLGTMLCALHILALSHFLWGGCLLKGGSNLLEFI